MLHLDNFSAWITIQGRETEEYAVEYSDDGLRASCYIASEAGKSFAIWWRDGVRTNDSMGRTYVDGSRCGVAKGINKTGYRSNLVNERDTACQNGVATSSTQARKLIFSDVSVTDEEISLDAVGEPQFESELGIIKLEISYVKRGDHARLKVIPFEPRYKVDERSRKGFSTQHQTRLGDPVTRQFNPMFSVKAFGAPRTFVFKYRPLHVLREMDVVPKLLLNRVIELTRASDEQEMTNGGDGIVEDPNNKTAVQGCFQAEDREKVTYVPYEFEGTAVAVTSYNEEKSPEKDNSQFPSNAVDFDSKDLIKKEIEDCKGVPALKVEPDESKIGIKTEPGVKVEIKTEEGLILRIKKEEEREVHNFLLTKTEAE